MQRLLFIAFLFVAGTVFAQYQLSPEGQPIQQQPLQAPPKWITIDGVPVQSHGPQPGQTPMPGYGSPYPTGQQVASPSGSVYGLPPQREPQAGPPPIYVAQANAPTGPDGRQHMGRAEPDSRIVPFVLTPAEQKELDDFLDRWEQFSAGIKSFEVDFTAWENIPFLNPNGPAFSTFGYFKYTAPNRFVFHVEGQWIDGKAVKGGSRVDKKIIDGNSIYDYDFKAKEVKQYKIAQELLARGFADSPLPIIFGAKADEMKKRFSMRIVTPDAHKDSQVWLQVKPLLLVDQQDFLGLEIRIDKKTLRAFALKKEDINDKAWTSYALSNHRINSPFEAIRVFFKPDIPVDMKLVVVEDLPLPQPAGPRSDNGLPRTANPYPPTQLPQPPNPGNEIRLY